MTNKVASRSGHRRLRKTIVLMLSALLALTVSGFVGVTAVSAAPINWIYGNTSESSKCLPADILVNSGLVPFQLQRYDVNGDSGELNLLGEVNLDRSFGDIALTPDGSTLYGIDWDIPMSLYSIDQQTGASTVIAPLTLPDGTPVPSIGLNSLSVAPDGRLFIGGSATTSIWYVDTATGSLELAPMSFPALEDGTTMYAGGDFLTIGNGLLLGLGIVSATTSYLVVFDLNANTSTIVGSVPKLYGAGQSAGHIYLAGADGTIYSLDEVPMTESENPIPVATRVVTGLSLFGATSSQDVTGCHTVTMSFQKVFTGNADEDGTGSVTEGDTLNYTLTAANIGEFELTNVTVSDDLTGNSVTCNSLAVNDICVLSVVYTVTEEDVAAGEVVNVGSAVSNETDLLRSGVTVPVPKGLLPATGAGDISLMVSSAALLLLLGTAAVVVRRQRFA